MQARRERGQPEVVPIDWLADEHHDDAEHQRRGRDESEPDQSVLGGVGDRVPGRVQHRGGEDQDHDERAGVEVHRAPYSAVAIELGRRGQAQGFSRSASRPRRNRLSRSSGDSFKARPYAARASSYRPSRRSSSARVECRYG